MGEIFRRIADYPALQKLREILLFSDLEFSELVTAFGAMTWGAWILLPWVRLSDPLQPALFELWRLAPDRVWAVGAIAFGALQAMALAANIVWLRTWASGALFVFWLSVSLLFVILHPESPHAPLYAALALAAGWAHLRAAVLRVYHPRVLDPRVEASARCSDL